MMGLGLGTRVFQYVAFYLYGTYRQKLVEISCMVHYINPKWFLPFMESLKFSNKFLKTGFHKILILKNKYMEKIFTFSNVLLLLYSRQA